MTLFFIFLLGLAVGSFLNVVIDRLPNGKSLLGRSHCDHCRKVLQPQDLVPVFSFFLQRGRCRYCKKRLSLQYPLIESVVGFSLIFTWLTFVSQGTETAVLLLAFVAILIAMFMADLKYQMIPDELQVGLFLVVTRLVFLQVQGDWVELLLRFSHAFVVMAPLLLIFIATRGRGMGFADVKLLFTLGFLFGIKLGLLIIYLAFISGGVVGMYLLLTRKKQRKSMIAFGPFIILSTFVILFNQITFMNLIDSFMR